METYKVKNNQNIFDVAIQLYGSVEGVFDLLINNSSLSFDTKLHNGQELLWNKDFVIHKYIVNRLNEQGLNPVNGERHVYYKETSQDLRCVIQIDHTSSNIILKVAGDGVMVVDWGDNTDLELINLSPVVESHQHFFDSEVSERIVKIYGDFNLKVWNLSPINGLLLPTKPLIVDEIEMANNKISIDGFVLFDGVYSVKMSNVTLHDLNVIRDMSLAYLDLQQIEYISPSAIDEYLIYIATHHNQRRNCTVVLDVTPSGVYQEPKKDSGGNYIITSGMEAIYVILHEPTWNEAGPWVFRINGVEIQK